MISVNTGMQVILILLFIISRYNVSSTNAFASLVNHYDFPGSRKGTGAGCSLQAPNKIDSTKIWEISCAGKSEVRLIVLQVTDVYTLDYFAHLKTLLEETIAISKG